MEFASVALQLQPSSCSFPSSTPSLIQNPGRRNFSSSSCPLFCLRVSPQGSQRTVKLTGGRLTKSCPFFFNSYRYSKSACEAVVGDKTAVPSDYAGEQSSLRDREASDEETSKICEKEENADDDEPLSDQKMTKVCDKLIGVFMVDKPTPTDWRRLLAFSKEWSNIRPHFFRRCQERADNEEDLGMKHQLLRLARKLKEIDVDVERHNELLGVIKAASDVSEIVARRRKDFTKEFFVHLHTVAQSYFDSPAEQSCLVKLGNTCLACIEAYDTASESTEAVAAAQLKLQDILNSSSLDAACRKIDNLAEKNQLDSALVLMITKAWSATKESNMTKDEVKDVLYHLYKAASGNLQRLVPKEIRIVKYLLMIEDPQEQFSALNDAFTPGEEVEGKDVDALYTTPEKLHTCIKAVVDAYHYSSEGTLIREAKDLMSPRIVQKLEQLQMLVEKKFM